MGEIVEVDSWLRCTRLWLVHSIHESTLSPPKSQEEWSVIGIQIWQTFHVETGTFLRLTIFWIPLSISYIPLKGGVSSKWYTLWLLYSASNQLRFMVSHNLLSITNVFTLPLKRCEGKLQMKKMKSPPPILFELKLKQWDNKFIGIHYNSSHCPTRNWHAIESTCAFN